MTFGLLVSWQAPFGLLVEKAGGKTSDGVSGNSVLDLEITGIDQRTALCIGSAKEVDRFNEMVLDKKAVPSWYDQGVRL